MKWVLWHERLTIERSERGVQHVAIDFLLSRATAAARPARSLARFPFSPPATPTELSRNLSRAEDSAPYCTNHRRLLLTRVAIYKKQGTRVLAATSTATHRNIQRSTLIHLSDRAFPVSTRDFGFRHGILGLDMGFWVSTRDFGLHV
jgi:hypothetical protein